jgi:hypothetical protein
MLGCVVQLQSDEKQILTISITVLYFLCYALNMHGRADTT